MASANDSAVTLTSHCLCKANIFTSHVPRSNLPLAGWMCHCTSCRHLTGALYSSSVRWPEPRQNVDVSKLKTYAFSPGVNLHFCPTCSTPMFWEMLEEPGGSLKLLTGTLANDEVVPVKFIKQIFLGDTADGGASVWLKHPNSDGSACKRFMLSADNGVASAAFPDEKFAGAGYEQKTQDSVPVRCRCKGIDYILRRGDYSGLDGDQLPWNVDPATHKYLTILCGCDSCRLQGGVDLWYWTYVEMKHLSVRQHNAPFPKSSYELKSLIDKGDPLAGSLSYYASSTNVLRFFCGTCSATVFYAEEKRPEILDLSVGLLEASDGARAEGFLSWWYGEIENKENADGGWRAEHFHRIENESEQWRIREDYPKNWKRIANEQEKAQDAK